MIQYNPIYVFLMQMEAIQESTLLKSFFEGILIFREGSFFTVHALGLGLGFCFVFDF